MKRRGRTYENLMCNEQKQYPIGMIPNSVAWHSLQFLLSCRMKGQQLLQGDTWQRKPEPSPIGASNLIAIASNLLAIASNLLYSDGLQPSRSPFHRAMHRFWGGPPAHVPTSPAVIQTPETSLSSLSSLSFLSFPCDTRRVRPLVATHFKEL